MIFSGNLSATDHAAEDKRVADFLNKAKQALALNRLTTPAKDNAASYAEQALAITPDHPDAIKLLEHVTERYDELVADRLEHGKQIQQKSLAQAKLFQKRAQGIVNQHNISDSALVAMKYKIANYDLANEVIQNKKTSDVKIENLLDQHIALSEFALEGNNIKEAQWHVRQADAMASRYGLFNHKLNSLKNRILSHTTTDKKRDTKNIKTLVATHIRLGKQALHEGDPDKAHIHQSIAKEIALQYGINNPELTLSSGHVIQQSAWNKSDTWLKIFGTF